METLFREGEGGKKSYFYPEEVDVERIYDVKLASALLAEAACRGAAYNVRINVSAMADKTAGQPLSAAAAALVVETHTLAQQATAAVEAAIGD